MEHNNETHRNMKATQKHETCGTTESITQGGQNLSDQDLLLVADISRNQLQNTTLKNGPT